MLHHNNHKAFQFSVLIGLYSHGAANSRVVEYLYDIHCTYNKLLSIGRDLAVTGNSAFQFTNFKPQKYVAIYGPAFTFI